MYCYTLFTRTVEKQNLVLQTIGKGVIEILLCFEI